MNIKIKVFIYLLVMVFAGTSLHSEEEYGIVVYLKDGSVIKGRMMVFIPEKYIIVEVENEKKLVFKMDEIEKIANEYVENLPEYQPQFYMLDYYYKQKKLGGLNNYCEAGISLGTPAGLNVNIGSWHNKLGLRFSGGFNSDKIYGLQAQILFALTDTKSIRHSIFAGGFASRINKNRYTVVAAGYDLNYEGFHFQFGLGTQFNNSIGAILQVGYLYRYID